MNNTIGLSLSKTSLDDMIRPHLLWPRPLERPRTTISVVTTVWTFEADHWLTFPIIMSQF